MPGWLQKFVMQPDIPVETAIKVYRRYLKIEPTHAEEYIAYLKIKATKPPRARSCVGRLNCPLDCRLNGLHSG